MSAFEEFFIERYKELERENASLKEEMDLLKAQDSEYGVFMRDKDIACVRVETVSAYYLDEGCFKGLDSEAVEAKKADIANAERWRLNYRNAIDRSFQTFPFSFEVKMPGRIRHYLVNESGGIDEYTPGDPSLGKWCEAAYDELLMDEARQELLEAMDDRIERLRKKEAESE